MRQEVKIGPSTIIGYSAAAAAAVAPMVGDLADSAEPLGVPPWLWVVVSAGLAVTTNLGRMWQAGKKAGDATLDDSAASDPFNGDLGDNGDTVEGA